MSQIHILDGQKDEILDYITAPNIISDDHKKSLEDTLETYEFITFADKRFSEHLEKRNRIIIPDEDGSLVEFRIFEAHKYKDTEGHKAEVFANATYLDLRQANVLFPDNGFTGTASQHAGRVLNNTGWQVGIAEGKGTRTLTINSHTNPYEMLKRIAREFELELKFRIEHDGNKVTGRYVDLLERVGQWRGREVEFGKDLDGIRRVEKQDIVTALLGLGPEREDGTRIEVLVTDEDALQRWGRIDEHGNLKHLIEPYEIQSERSEMTDREARQYTRTALNKRINTQITYETTIVDLEEVPGMENKKIRFGDTIKIKDTSFNPPLYLEARVFEQNRSIKSKAKKDIKLGDFIEYTEEEVNAIWEQLKKQIQNRVSFYEMAEYTYDKLTIDDKDETVFEDGKTFAEATGIRAEENAKAFAVEEDKKIKLDVEQYADTVAEQKANSALEQAKMYAVAKTVYENQMQQIASDIADRAPIEYVDGELRHAIDNLEIGGTNLIIESEILHDTRFLDDGILESYSGTWTTGKISIDGASHITYSTNGKHEFKIVGFWDENDEIIPPRYVNTNPNVKEVTLEVPQGAVYTRFYSRDYESGYFQVEKGTKATDWSPAPEDVFSEIEKKADGSTVYTIEQIDNKINNLVSVTQYTTDMDGIVTQLESHGTRIGQNEHAIGLKADASHVDSVEQSLTTKIGNVEVKADGVITQVSEVRADLDGLEIGGRNLITGSAEPYTFSVTTDNYTFWVVYRGLERNTTYTFSAKVEVLQGNVDTVSLYPYLSAGQSMSRIGMPIVNGKVFGTFTTDDRYDYNLLVYNGKAGSTAGNQIRLIEYKLEKGTKATDWSPAPEDTDEAINQVSGRVETLDGEITALAGEVSLKASQSVVDSLEGRVSTAEGTLSVLPGQIELKVSKDGVINAIEMSPETTKFSANRVEFAGHVFGKDATFNGRLEAKEGYFGDNIRLRNGKMEIVRPDGAVSMTDGMIKESQAVGGFDPMFMGNQVWSSGSETTRSTAFPVISGYFQNNVGALDGRLSGFSDVRNSNYRSSIRIQRYSFTHIARYFVLTYRSQRSTDAGMNNLHRHLALIYDSVDNKLAEHEVPQNTTETVDLIVDLGVPDYTSKWLDFRIGWAASWGNADDHIRFRINSVVQTDFI